MAKRTTSKARASTVDDAPLTAASPATTNTQRPLPALSSVLGQPDALRSITRVLDSGRVHHAWIFHGPKGVGKFRTALAFASVLLDPTSRKRDDGAWAPDADSMAQGLLRAGVHPDLHIITKEMSKLSPDRTVRDAKQRNIPLSIIRDYLIEPAAKTRAGTSGSGLADKVFIVDEAELLANFSQNAILKTLEEPPPGTVLILVTDAEHDLLPTIRSRAQRIGFTPLDDQAMSHWYRSAGMPPEPDHRQWLLRYACGAPGWVAAAVTNELISWEGALVGPLDELSRGRFPLELGPTMKRLIEDRASEQVKANPDASKEAATHAWTRRLLGFLAERTRMGLRRAGSPDAHHEPLRAEIEWHLNALELIDAAGDQIESNVNTEQVMDNLVAQLLAAPRQ